MTKTEHFLSEWGEGCYTGEDELLPIETANFRRLSFDPCFEKELGQFPLIRSLDSFAVVTGRLCSGKSMHVRALVEKYPFHYIQLPEAKDINERGIRPGEKIWFGGEIIPLSSEGFDQALKENDFWLAYEWRTGGREGRSGILRRTLKRAVHDDRMKVVVAMPEVASYLRTLFPLLRCVPVVQSSIDDYRQYADERGEDVQAWFSQNETGAGEDEESKLPPLSMRLENNGSLCRQVRAIHKFLKTRLVRPY